MPSAKKSDRSQMMNVIGAVEEKRAKASVRRKPGTSKLQSHGGMGEEKWKKETEQIAGKSQEKFYARDDSGCRKCMERTKNRLHIENVAKTGEKSEEENFTNGTSSERRKQSNAEHSGSDKILIDQQKLEAHVEAIRERRNSLPRTITIDPSGDMEIVIGDDGKPCFQPTITPKAEEIQQEFAEIVLEVDDKDGCPHVKRSHK